MKQYDVIVVGAGPAGGFAAGEIAKHGYSVGLLEEHREIGRPVQCAGLVTHRVFDILGKKQAVLNEVTGARVHFPSQNTLTFSGKKPKACVIDRADFDKFIAERAVDNKAELLLRTKVISIIRVNGGFKIQVRKNGNITDLECRLLIGSDGCGSLVARSLGFPSPKEVLSGFGAEYTGGKDYDKEYVDIFVGNQIAPGFFAWMIPTNEGTRVGLCTSRGEERPNHYFKNLLTHPAVKERLKGAEIERYIAGTIPLGFVKKPYSSGMMLVGDSAYQVKPLSGGGIYMGLLCAGHCAKVAVTALKVDDFSERTLKRYGQLVQDDVGRELKRAGQLRRIYTGLNDSHLEEGFQILNDQKILDFIAEHGDIDYPSGLTKAVFQKAPRLMKFAGPVLKSLI